MDARKYYERMFGIGLTITAIIALLILTIFFPGYGEKHQLIINLLTIAVLIGLFLSMFASPKSAKELFDNARRNGMTTGFIALLVPLMMSSLTKYLASGVFVTQVTINPLFLAWIGIVGFALGHLGYFLFNWKSVLQVTSGKRIVLYDIVIYVVALSVVILII